MFKKRIIITFLFLCFALNVKAQTSSVSEGVSLLNQGKTYDATIWFQTYVRNNPNDSDAHYYLGLCYKNVNNIKGANEEFQKAYDLTIGVKVISERESAKTMDVKTALVKGVDKDYYDLAKTYYQNGDIEMAQSYLKMIDNINPENYEAIYLKAFIAHYDGNEEEAKKLFAKALMLNPSYETSDLGKIYKFVKAEKDKLSASAKYDFNFYNDKAIQYYAVADFNQAQSYFTKALEFQPKNPEVYNNLGMLMLKKGDYKNAKKYLKKSVKIDGKYPETYLNLAQLSGLRGFSLDELNYLKKAIKVNPNSAVSHYLLGNYYLKKANYTLAIESFKKAVSLNPKFYEAYYSMGLCYFDMEKYSDSLVYLKSADEINPNSDKLNYYIAKISLLTNRKEEAQNHLMKAIEFAENSDYLYELGKLYIDSGDYSEAQICFKDALALQKNPEYYNYLGLTQYKMHEPKMAVENFKKAVELSPRRPIYCYNLAQCYKSLKDNKLYYNYKNKAFAIRPVDYFGYLDLSSMNFDEGNSSAALNILEEAILKYPENINVYIAKSKLLDALGDKKGMIEVQRVINMKFKVRI